MTLHKAGNLLVAVNDLKGEFSAQAFAVLNPLLNEVWHKVNCSFRWNHKSHTSDTARSAARFTT